MDDVFQADPTTEPNGAPTTGTNPGPERLLATYLEELGALYALGSELEALLNKMSAAAAHTELTRTLRAHVATTRGQLRRLDLIFDDLDRQPEGAPKDAAAGLLSLAAQAVCGSRSQTCRDIGLVAAAQRLERCELSLLRTAYDGATQLGRDHDTPLLADSYEETANCEQRLDAIAQAIVGSLTWAA